MYTITIDKKKDNPKFDPDRINYWNTDRYIVERSLTVDLTDEEFQAIKKAVVEVM